MSRSALPRRRQGRLLALPLSLVLAAVGLKLVTMWVFAEWGTEAYGDERYASAESAFRLLEPANVIEPALAHVGVGVSLYRQGDLVGAELAFTDVLDEDAGDCEVRFDLAVTIEAQGDRLIAGEPIAPPSEEAVSDSIVARSDPIQRYRAVLDVLDGGSCPASDAGDVGDRLDATRERVEAKLRALRDVTGDNRSDDPQGTPESERGDSEQVDDVELRNQAGARQREAARDADTRGITPDGQSNW